MTELECPLDGCQATIGAESETEAVAQAEAHMSSAHPELDLDDETVENIKSSITDV